MLGLATLALITMAGWAPASAEQTPGAKPLLTSQEVEAAVAGAVSRGPEADRLAASAIAKAGVFKGPALDSLQNPWLIDERGLTKILGAAASDQSEDIRLAVKRLLDEHYSINMLGAIRKAALVANDKLPPLSNDQAERIAIALVTARYSPVADSLKVVGNVEHNGLHPVLLYGKGQNGVFRYFGVMLDNLGDVLHDDASDFPDLLRWGRVPNEYDLERL